jgi:hypothetical protein
VLLVIAGTGFSEDSSLTTYLDVADIDCYLQAKRMKVLSDADLQMKHVHGQCSRFKHFIHVDLCLAQHYTRYQPLEGYLKEVSSEQNSI